jgi:hypothetical protein
MHGSEAAKEGAMLRFAARKRRVSSSVKHSVAPAVTPMTPSRYVQHAKIRNILRSSQLQTKLTIGQPHDKHEEEADRMAEQVIRMSEPQVRSEIEEEEELLETGSLGELIQTQVTANGEGKISSESSLSKNRGSMSPVMKRDENDERHYKILFANTEVRWAPDGDPKVNKSESGALYGLGMHRPHGMKYVGVFEKELTKPPKVSLKYNDDERAWIIQSVTAFTEVDVMEPVEEAYPRYREKNPDDNNVVDNEKLGTRDPLTGKGHWVDVITNLCQYGTENYRPQDMFWWVRNSTLYHEKVHHREYKKWFNKKWDAFQRQMGGRLQEQLEMRQIDPVNHESMKNGAEAVLKDIILQTDGPGNTEPQAYGETRERYWAREADDIKKYFMKVNYKKTPPIQRQVEEEEKRGLHIKQEFNHAPAVNPDLESRILSLHGGGQPLPESVQAFFEPRFGYDFCQVRVHADSKAAESARAVNARAFTVGHHVVMGAGQYSPGTAEGRRLLAHELTHVVQQGNPQAQGKFLTAKPDKQQIPTGASRIQRQQGATPPQCPTTISRVIFNLYASGIGTGATYLRPGSRMDFHNFDTRPHRIRMVPGALFSNASFSVNPGGTVSVIVMRTRTLTGASIVDNPGSGQTVHDVVVCP